jgi:Zn-dependent protease
MKMKYSLSLGRVAGIQIFVHWTFLILIGWIVYLNLKQGMGTIDILWSVLFILTLFACVTAHELGHALAANTTTSKHEISPCCPLGVWRNWSPCPKSRKRNWWWRWPDRW